MAIAAAALMAGGALADDAANRKVVKAREGAALAENQRQEALDREQAALFSDTLGGFERPQQEADLIAGRSARHEAVDSAVQATDPAIPVPGSTPKVVKGAVARALSDSLKAGRAHGKAQANLLGYGDLSFGNALNLSDSGRQTATLGDFSRRSSMILPMELEAASSKGAGLRSFGQLLGGAGQLVGLAGFAGMGPQSWGSLFGSSPAPAGMYMGGTATNPLTGLRVGGV